MYTVAEAYAFEGDIASPGWFGPNLTRPDIAILGVTLEFAKDTEPVQEGQPFILYQNQPNPFHEKTNIGFYLPEKGRITLVIYDMSGNVLISVNDVYSAGFQEIEINRSLFPGKGVYYYQLKTAYSSVTKKMLIVG